MNKNMKRLIKSAESVPDSRRPWGHLLHKLSDILVIAFRAIICGAQTYRDLEIFGNAKFGGKTMRGSRREDSRGIHVLSAFLTDAQIVMGEIMCDERSNEITAGSQ